MHAAFRLRSIALGATLTLLALASCSTTNSSESPDRIESGPRGSTGVATSDAERGRLLVELGLTRGQAWDRLQELTHVAPKRLSGSAGNARAVEWAAETMRLLGLTRVRLDPVRVPQWERGAVERVTLLGPGPRRDLACLALGGSVGTRGLEGELVIVRSPRELENRDVKGKIVLFNRPMPRALRNTFQAYRAAVPQRASGPVEAAKHGAIACLVRSMTTRLDDVPHTGSTRYELGIRRIPALAISTQAAEDLAALASSGTAPRVEIETTARNLGEVDSANVLGEIRGSSKPEEIVLIGAHLDAWDVGQGAHDDGAGVAQCLEAMRLLLESGFDTKRTIRCVLFANEENGLRGARAYDEQHGTETHKAAIESDRGGFEPRGFTTSAKPTRHAAIRAMLLPLAAEIDAGRLIPGGGGADIAPLGARGVELFGLLPAWHRYFDYHHSERDRLEAVNPRELQLGAIAIAWLAMKLANE